MLEFVRKEASLFCKAPVARSAKGFDLRERVTENFPFWSEYPERSDRIFTTKREIRRNPDPGSNPGDACEAAEAVSKTAAVVS